MAKKKSGEGKWSLCLLENKHANKVQQWLLFKSEKGKLVEVRKSCLYLEVFHFLLSETVSTQESWGMYCLSIVYYRILFRNRLGSVDWLSTVTWPTKQEEYHGQSIWTRRNYKKLWTTRKPILGKRKGS